MSEKIASPSPLRILEIGDKILFKLAVPTQTTFYWTGHKKRNRAKQALGPIQFIKTMIALRSDKFDLLVIHAPQYAPWHPRSFLMALLSWNIKAPLGLFSLFAWRFIHLFHKVPVVAIHLGDSFGIGKHNFFLFDRCKAFFKRELPSDHWQVFFKSGPRDYPGAHWRRKPAGQRWIKKLKPISHGTSLTPPENSCIVKTADIFFSGMVEPNNTARITGLEEVRALEREGFVIDIPTSRLSPSEFLQRMSAAWIAWSPAGLGWDCGRHYEAAMAGTVPMMNYPTIMRDRPLKDGEHCILYPVEQGGLAEAARSALANKTRLQEMAQAARAHVLANHTDYARAEYLVNTVLELHLDGTELI